MGKLKLLGMTPSELSELAKECGLPAYAGKQMARWMYVRKVRSIDDMTDIRYISTKEAAGIMGLSTRRVVGLCNAGKS